MRIPFIALITAGTLLLALASPGAHGAAMLLNQVGSGSVTIGAGAGNSQTVNFPAIGIDRTASGFGETGGIAMSTVEGVFYTYTFNLVPGSGGRFDVQHQMNQLWSGWGSANNGEWQRGPTSSTWNRGVRFQHDYPGGTPTTRAGTPGQNAPGFPLVPNNTLFEPTAGDLLRVEVYLDAIRNEIDYVYSNLTTGETFSYTVPESIAGVPTSNILNFNSIAFRTDFGGPTTFDYTYGTFGVVPEPGRALLLTAGLLGWMTRRRR